MKRDLSTPLSPTFPSSTKGDPKKKGKKNPPPKMVSGGIASQYAANWKWLKAEVNEQIVQPVKDAHQSIMGITNHNTKAGSSANRKAKSKKRNPKPGPYQY